MDKAGQTNNSMAAMKKERMPKKTLGNVYRRIALGVSLGCLLIGMLVVALSPSSGLVVRLQQIKAAVGLSASAEFALTNTGSAFISLSVDAPQILSEGTWKSALG